MFSTFVGVIYGKAKHAQMGRKIFFIPYLKLLLLETGLVNESTAKMLSLPIMVPQTTLPQLAIKPGMTHTSMLTLEYMAPFRTSPLRIQMIVAAGLALSAWHVRLSGSPALRLTTGPPLITGSSGGTVDTDTEKEKAWDTWWPYNNELVAQYH